MLFVAFILLLAFTGIGPACAAEATEEQQNDEEPIQDVQDAQQSTSLIIYFSHTGNTFELAKHIQELTGADIFQIEPVIPYPDEYDACVAQARAELADEVWPELQNHVDDIASYDTIYLGYPIWISTIPRPVATFLAEHDLEGKIIAPFCTYGGGGISNSVTDITALVPQAIVTDGFGVTGPQASEAKDAVAAWLEEMQQ